MPKATVLDSQNLIKAAKHYRAINNKIRQKILHLIHKNGRMKVFDIYRTLKFEQSVVSAHLSILRKAHLVLWEKEG